MRNIIIITIALSFIFTSCFEILPDLSPDTASGNELIVKTYQINNSLTFDNNQGVFKTTQKFDMNDDGKEDFWFVKVPFTEIGYDNGITYDTTEFESYFLAINGEFLAHKLPLDDIVNLGVSVMHAYPLSKNSIVGNVVINNAQWMSGGYKYNSNPYPGIIPGTYEFAANYGLMKPNDTKGYLDRVPYSYKGVILKGIFTCYVSDCSFGNNDDEIWEFYFPIRIPINGKKHYGWIKLNSNGNEIVTAIATEPDKRLITGQVK